MQTGGLGLSATRACLCASRISSGGLRYAVRVIWIAGTRLSRCRRKGLGRVGQQLAGVIRRRFCRIDGWIDLGIQIGFRHRDSLNPDPSMRTTRGAVHRNRSTRPTGRVHRPASSSGLPAPILHCYLRATARDPGLGSDLHDRDRPAPAERHPEERPPEPPQIQGNIERFQQTLKKWLRVRPDQPRTLTELQALIDTFTTLYTSSGRTGPCRTGPPRPPSTPRCPRPSPAPIAAAIPTTAPDTTRSTKPAASPCASPAGSATSASAEPTPEPTHPARPGPARHRHQRRHRPDPPRPDHRPPTQLPTHRQTTRPGTAITRTCTSQVRAIPMSRDITESG